MGPFRAPSQDGKTALHYAAENGMVAAMEALAAMGADLNAATEVRSPLRASCESEKREKSGCSSARVPVMRGAQACMSRPRKSCARHDAYNHIKLEK